MPTEIINGMVLENLDVKLSENKNVWTIMNGKLEEPMEYEGENMPTYDQMQAAKLYYGYSKAKMNYNLERKLIVISPVDISS